MHQRIFSSLIIITGLIIVFPYCLRAEQTARISAYDILESSLLGLKESAQKLEDKNSWLSSEVEQLRLKTKDLQARFKKIDTMKPSPVATGQPSHPKFKQDVGTFSKTEQDFQRVPGDGRDSLDLEEAALEQNLELKRKQQEDLRQQLLTLQQETAKLSQDLQLVTPQGRLKSVTTEKNRLSKLIAASDKNIAGVEQRIKQFKKSQSKLINMLRALEDSNASLKQELAAGDIDHKAALDEGNAMASEVENVKKEKEEQLSRMGEEINKLSARSKELDDILTKAKVKLGGTTQINPLAISEEEYQLRHNLSIMQTENITLKSEFSALAKKLEEMRTQ